MTKLTLKRAGGGEVHVTVGNDVLYITEVRDHDGHTEDRLDAPYVIIEESVRELSEVLSEAVSPNTRSVREPTPPDPRGELLEALQKHGVRGNTEAAELYLRETA